jgi:hypothetical protein
MLLARQVCCQVKMLYPQLLALNSEQRLVLHLPPSWPSSAEPYLNEGHCLPSNPQLETSLSSSSPLPLYLNITKSPDPCSVWHTSPLKATLTLLPRNFGASSVQRESIFHPPTLLKTSWQLPIALKKMDSILAGPCYPLPGFSSHCPGGKNFLSLFQVRWRREVLAEWVLPTHFSPLLESKVGF